MPKKPAEPNGGEKRGPGRPPGARPTVTVYARISPELGAAFAAAVEEVRPKTSQSSVVEMLIEQWLRDNGNWPPTDTSKK